MTQNESLLAYLPAALQRTEQELPPGQESFIARFLRIFAEGFAKLEFQVDRLPQLFDPWKCDAKMLPWLASWLALQLKEEWGEETKRALASKMASIYRRRGTLDGLRTILEIHLAGQVREIKESPDTPHVFVITLNFPTFDPGELARKTRAIREVIEAEKPAHTYFEFDIRGRPAMQIGKHSQVGVDTILGTEPNAE